MAQMFCTLVPPFTATQVSTAAVTTGVAKVRSTTPGSLGLSAANTHMVPDSNQADKGWLTNGYEEITPNIIGLVGNVPALWFYHNNDAQPVYVHVWIP